MTQSEVPGSEFSGTGLRHGRAAVAAAGFAPAPIERATLLQADTAPARPAAANPRNARRLVCSSIALASHAIQQTFSKRACVLCDPL
jgi:hypothetical protein